MQKDLTPYYNIVEEALGILGVPIEAARAKDEEGKVQPGQWNLKKSGQSIWIDLWHMERENRPYFQVIAPMMYVNESINPNFYSELLEANNELFGVAFAISRNRVIIKVVREVEGLDANEAYAMIMRVGTYATHYGPIFKDKYFKNDNPGQAPKA